MDLNTHLSQLPSVRIWGEVYCSPEPGLVCCKGPLTLTLKLYRSSCAPGGTNQWGLVNGCRSRVTEMFQLVTDHFGLDPERQTSPWSPHYHRLSRLLFLIAMHHTQPQIKIWDHWEIRDWQPIILKMDKRGFCALMELRWP